MKKSLAVTITIVTAISLSILTGCGNTQTTSSDPLATPSTTTETLDSSETTANISIAGTTEDTTATTETEVDATVTTGNNATPTPRPVAATPTTRTTTATTRTTTATTTASGTTPRGTGSTVPNANPTNVTGVTGGATEATTPKPTATPTATPKPTATPTPIPKTIRSTMEIGWSDEFKAFLWSKGVDPATVARPTTIGVVIYDRDGNAIDTTDFDSAVAAMEREAEAITVQYGYVDEYGYSRGGYGYVVSNEEVLETFPN